MIFFLFQSPFPPHFQLGKTVAIVKKKHVFLIQRYSADTEMHMRCAVF